MYYDVVSDTYKTVYTYTYRVFGINLYKRFFGGRKKTGTARNVVIIQSRRDAINEKLRCIRWREKRLIIIAAIISLQQFVLLLLLLLLLYTYIILYYYNTPVVCTRRSRCCRSNRRVDGGGGAGARESRDAWLWDIRTVVVGQLQRSYKMYYYYYYYYCRERKSCWRNNRKLTHMLHPSLGH